MITVTALADAPTQSLNILVVCPESGAENILAQIRKWNFQEESKHKKWHIHSTVHKEFDLFSALGNANKNIEQSILVPIGFYEQEIRNKLLHQEQKRLEIIVRPPRPLHYQKNELNDRPSSSLLKDKLLINVQNTLPALRKSFLKRYFKNKIVIKSLQSKADFKQYYRLRYDVWKKMSYLPEERDSRETQWELDFTDRTALPIGAFDKKGRLIACARLVFPAGKENHYVKLIKELLDKSADKKLLRNFSYPHYLTHPFDILEAFDGFNEYYAQLVRNQLEVAEVSRVIVAAEYRSSGLGEVIVDSLVTMAQEREQLDLIFLACKKDHERFYQRCGFEALKGIESDHFVNQTTQSIAMVQCLHHKRCAACFLDDQANELQGY